MRGRWVECYRPETTRERVRVWRPWWRVKSRPHATQREMRRAVEQDVATLNWRMVGYIHDATTSSTECVPVPVSSVRPNNFVVGLGWIAEVEVDQAGAYKLTGGALVISEENVEGRICQSPIWGALNEQTVPFGSLQVIVDSRLPPYRR